MLLREVEYSRPQTVEEAIRVLSEHDGARPLAGGQTLVNVMKARAASPDILVDLQDLGDLRGITETGQGGLEIGAMTTYAQLMTDEAAAVTIPVPSLPIVTAAKPSWPPGGIVTFVNSSPGPAAVR